MLHVAHLHAGYGQATVLHDITFTVPTGTIHAVVGPNGAGKTTLLHTIAGLHPTRTGTIHNHGQALHRQPAHRIARTGVALVPQGRRVFATLTVQEHLHLAARQPGGPWTPPRLFTLLPALQPLRHRPGRYLSGGEQQLLAIARALATNPALLLLDEPTEGLAPALATTIRNLIASLAYGGTTILLTAQPPTPSPTPPPTSATVDSRRYRHPSRSRRSPTNDPHFNHR